MLYDCDENSKENCDENSTIKFQANFDEDFDNVMLKIIGGCKRLYFLDSQGFGINSKPSNSKFNRSVNLLPETLTHIKFGYSFNQPVDNLPYNLLWLEFGFSFNQSIDMLPNTIIYLVFGDKFNKSVDNLPNCLEYLSFGYEFNHSLDSLPESILYVNIGNSLNITGSEFNQTIYNLPKKINNICIWKPKNKKSYKYVIKSDFINQLNIIVKKL